MTSTSAPRGSIAADDNHVFLRGRLAADPVQKELPSGDVLLTFRVTVPRPAAERGHVDSLDCVATLAKVRRVLGRARPGDPIEVEGRLRRRFWRGPAGPQSRYAVDVRLARLPRSANVVTAGRRGDA